VAARRGLAKRYRSRALAAELARQLPPYVLEGAGPLGIPPDQAALVGLAADRIAPTIAAGHNIEDEPTIDLIAGYLLGEYARALHAVSARGSIEMLRERFGSE
jgi:hypothetical protein